MSRPSTRVRFGADRLCEQPALVGTARRVGLVTNDAARLATDANTRARVALQRALRAADCSLVRLFGPEHGLSASAADGAAVRDDTDALTGLPVVSLYGERMRPRHEDLRDLDAVLFDIPDVGARFYTYTWTLYHVLDACADAGIPLIVLDRPNPLGGLLADAEGPLLEPSCRSFIGEDAIPIRHQLTHGELARLWQHERHPHADVRVIACDGWTRAMYWPDTHLPWIATSPAMPSFASAQCYPGTCLFEATNLSVGRGLDTPFQVIGAPWLDGKRVINALPRDMRQPLRVETVRFTPPSAPYHDFACAGLMLHLTSDVETRPVAAGLALLAAVRRAHPTHFNWADYPTAANPTGADHFERLIGRRDIRAVFDVAPETIDDACIRAWTATGDWTQRVAPILLYD